MGLTIAERPSIQGALVATAGAADQNAAAFAEHRGERHDIVFTVGKDAAGLRFTFCLLGPLGFCHGGPSGTRQVQQHDTETVIAFAPILHTESIASLHIVVGDDDFVSANAFQALCAVDD